MLVVHVHVRVRAGNRVEEFLAATLTETAGGASLGEPGVLRFRTSSRTRPIRLTSVAGRGLPGRRCLGGRTSWTTALRGAWAGPRVAEMNGRATGVDPVFRGVPAGRRGLGRAGAPMDGGGGSSSLPRGRIVAGCRAGPPNCRTSWPGSGSARAGVQRGAGPRHVHGEPAWAGPGGCRPRCFSGGGASQRPNWARTGAAAGAGASTAPT